MDRSELPELLFRHVKMVEPYPDTVVAVEKMTDMTAFFPGGKGLWLAEPCDRFPTILVLGQDFSTEEYYIEMMKKTERDLDSPTWYNMISLFRKAEVDLCDCFFSNVFMGLRKTQSMVGEFPGFKDKEFVRRNLNLLSIQISMIQPETIITLGKYAANQLSMLSDDLESWRNWRALTTPDIGLQQNVMIGSHCCHCVALEHPSMRNSNVKRRKFGPYLGDQAEIMMLRETIWKTR